MLASLKYRLSASARQALAEYIPLRRAQPFFANARSIRNALDRVRLRQANRLFAERDRELTFEAITTIEAEDIRQSRLSARRPLSKRARGREVAPTQARSIRRRRS